MAYFFFWKGIGSFNDAERGVRQAVVLCPQKATELPSDANRKGRAFACCWDGSAPRYLAPKSIISDHICSMMFLQNELPEEQDCAYARVRVKRMHSACCIHPKSQSMLPPKLSCTSALSNLGLQDKDTWSWCFLLPSEQNLKAASLWEVNRAPLSAQRLVISPCLITLHV